MRVPTTSNHRSVLVWIGMLVALLLIASASRGGIDDTATGAPLAGFSTGLAILFSVVLLGTVVAVTGLVALVIRRPRRRRDDEPDRYVPPVVGRWWGLAAVVMVLGVATAFVVVVITVARSAAINEIGSSGSAPRPHPANRSVHAVGAHSSGPSIHLLIAIITLLAVATFAVIFARVRPSLRLDRTPATSPGTEAQLPELVEQATLHAQRAIAEAGSPRAAVIGSYLAMSRAISTATGAPTNWLTPRRLLREAADRGVIDRANGAIVTHLFERARFSTAPITERDRRKAADALAGLRRIPSQSDSTP